MSFSAASTRSAPSEAGVPGVGVDRWLSLLFPIGALLLLAATRLTIPFLVEGGLEPVVAWFVAAGFGVFLPLVVVAAAVSRPWRPGSREALRFGRLDRAAVRATLLGLVVAGAIGAVMVPLLEVLDIPLAPSYLQVEPLTADRWWIVVAWVPFFLLNILGEEFVWRGVVLPAQERRRGGRAWLFNLAGWVLFHVPLGPGVMLGAAGIFVVVPLVAQRHRSTWAAVAIHGGLNGPAFVAVLFGLV